jgi:hypothetical protein
MTNGTIGTIAFAAGNSVGSSIRIVGVVVAVRQLGKVSFVLIRDSFSELQVVVSGELQKKLRNQSPPFYATVSGVLRRRPEQDVRSHSVNGSIEVDAQTVDVHQQGGRPLDHPLDELLQLTTLLQQQGFLDVNTLARAFAPSYFDLMSSVDGLGPVKHLAYLLGPCRWYFATDGTLYFGLCPGYVADLRSLFEVDGQSVDATARKIVDQASWHDEHAGPSAAGAPIAYGAIAIRSRADGIEQSLYWRDHHAIAHLGSGLVATAANRPKLDDAAVRALEEGISRSDALLQEMAGTGEKASTAIILRDLTKFDLQARHTKEIIALFPSLEKRLAHSSGEQQFELLWSILGHDHVKAVFSSPESVAVLTRCVQAGMFSDYNMLRSLDPGTLRSIGALTRNFTDRDSIAFIDRMFSASPSVAASACYLMRELDEAGLDWRRGAAIAKRGIASRLAFAAAATGVATADEVARWRNDLAARLRHLFTNEPVHEASCWLAFAASAARFPWAECLMEQCREADRTFDLVQLTFGNGLVAYDDSARMYSEASDCSSHWASAGIDFGGERWNPVDRHFDLTGFWLYPSKNKPAILAKSCSGICSARNVELFHRKDHFQFTLVDPEAVIAAGTVQMYTHQDEKGREIWVVRGLNPSEKVVVESVGFTIELLDTLASLARHNGVGALVCADGAGLFSADSSRLSIRAILRRSAAISKRIYFHKPLHIFDYHDRAISIEYGWQIWP